MNIYGICFLIIEVFLVKQNRNSTSKSSEIMANVALRNY